MPLLETARRMSQIVPPPPVPREFGQVRVRSCPAGHSRLDPGSGGDVRPLLLIWARGGGVIRQHGRMIDANADALCFLPNNAPVWLCDLGPGGAVAIELPAGLEVRVRERFSDVLGATITAATGAAAFLRGFLETLDAQPPTYRPDSPSWVQTCVCEITERVLTESTGTRPSPAQRALSTARDYVIMHLTDPGLTPDRVAREAAVSLRTLNRLFAADGDSVGGCIRRCRLERCRIDLLDPAKADRTISQIGATWGFPEAAHFSRVFKDAYGCSPRAFRSGPAITHEQSGFSVHRVA